jgi:hypothetical protein
MKKRNLFLHSILITCFFAINLQSAKGGPEETATQVINAIQTGNAAEAGKHFNSMIDLTIPGYDDSYSKAQASQILKEFFQNQPVKNIRVTRQGNSPDGSQYTLGTLETAKKTYRVYFLIKMVGGQYLVHQFQIQDQ